MAIPAKHLYELHTRAGSDVPGSVDVGVLHHLRFDFHAGRQSIELYSREYDTAVPVPFDAFLVLLSDTGLFGKCFHAVVPQQTGRKNRFRFAAGFATRPDYQVGDALGNCARRQVGRFGDYPERHSMVGALSRPAIQASRLEAEYLLPRVWLLGGDQRGHLRGSG